jgi:sugar lactone lactonase YvrE
VPAGVLCQTPTSIEAVEYDPAGDRWFVSNGATLLVTEGPGAGWEVFGTAQATHGMEVVDGMLVAIGGNVLRAYDLATAELLGTLSIPGASFLNGMGSIPGTLVVSDFGNGRIHRIDVSDPAAMQATLLATVPGSPNGVVIDEAGGRAIVVMWGTNADVLAVDLATGSVTTLVNGTGLGNLDGIDVDGEGRYYVSSWSPARITRFQPDFSTPETVVSSGLSSPADISYAVALDTLAVANSGNDVVTWHSFAPAVGVGESGSGSGSGSANAQWDGAGLVLQCSAPGRWRLAAFAADGREVAAAVYDLPAGEVRVAEDRLPPAACSAWVLQLAAPDGTVHAVRPGPRQR